MPIAESKTLHPKSDRLAMTASKTTDIHPSLKIDTRKTSIEHSERNFFSERFQKSTLFTDVFSLNISLVVGLFIAGFDITMFVANYFVWIAFFISANSIWLTIAMYNDLYKWYEIIKPRRKVREILYVNGIFFAVLSSLYYYVFFPVFYVNFLLPAMLLFFIVNTISHLLFRKHFQRKMPLFKYIIVGGKPGTLNYIQQTYQNTYKKSVCLGGFANDPTTSCLWLGDYTQLKRYVKQNPFDKLFYVYSDLKKKEIKRIMELCESRFIDFEIVPREIDLIEGETRLISESNLPTLAPQIEPLQRLRNKIVKRTFDIVFSLAVILLVFPWLVPIVAILIKLESKGPTFFVQSRTGYWNKPFGFIKFRSMTVNDESNVKQATRNDTRVTKIGRFLRKTSLDEMPQFFNVIKGDMSVVGPRPHMQKHTEEYSDLIETYLVRHRVKPGITGWAQINGYRGPTETLDKMEKRVQYDVHYMKNWTIIMDIRCVIMTVINMIRGEKNAV
ncbi:MAG: exopolysaccharide biosynthesis polyprenyl glycosylphosphotransferase [Bacteroidota bacterium]